MACTAFAGATLVPWLAGVEPPAAAVLATCALTGLRAAILTVPGPRAPLCRLEGGGRGWVAVLKDGRSVPAAILPGTRVLPWIVLCRLAVDGRRVGWSVPRSAVSASDFRRLKGALRASAGGAAC
ncbi:MAG: hypothetical protein AMJ58_05590 [Gammaproteobacteria bacterium SG8_30]|nr:MAG: hypothetical protein AMJ58_05590 [Gammaproteobacteria bacterium SG8_30]